MTRVHERMPFEASLHAYTGDRPIHPGDIIESSEYRSVPLPRTPARAMRALPPDELVLVKLPFTSRDGFALDRANRLAIEELLGRGPYPGVYYLENTDGDDDEVAFDARSTDANLVSIAEALGDHPVLDDDVQGELELDEQEWAWDNYTQEEYLDALTAIWEHVPGWDETVKFLGPTDGLASVFRHVAETEGIEWEEREPAHWVIYTDEVARHTHPFRFAYVMVRRPPGMRLFGLGSPLSRAGMSDEEWEAKLFLYQLRRQLGMLLGMVRPGEDPADPRLPNIPRAPDTDKLLCVIDALWWEAVQTKVYPGPPASVDQDYGIVEECLKQVGLSVADVEGYAEHLERTHAEQRYVELADAWWTLQTYVDHIDSLRERGMDESVTQSAIAAPGLGAPGEEEYLVAARELAESLPDLQMALETLERLYPEGYVAWWEEDDDEP